METERETYGRRRETAIEALTEERPDWCGAGGRPGRENAATGGGGSQRDRARERRRKRWWWGFGWGFGREARQAGRRREEIRSRNLDQEKVGGLECVIVGRQGGLMQKKKILA